MIQLDKNWKIFFLSLFLLGNFFSLSPLFGEESNLYQKLESQGSARIFYELVKESGSASLLEQKGPFTLFVPQDQAFSRLPTDFLKRLKENKKELLLFVSHHIAPGNWKEKYLKIQISQQVTKIDLKTLLAQKKEYHQRRVEIAGKVSDFGTMNMGGGKGYQYCTLEKENSSILVRFSLEAKDLPSSGQEVSLLGTFVLSSYGPYLEVGEEKKSSSLLKDLDGNPLQSSLQEGSVCMEGCKILQADVISGNGVLHVLENVMLPQAWKNATPGAEEKKRIPLEKGKTYRHPLGFSFRYPDQWTITPTDQGLALVPPQFKGGYELYAITGMSAGDIKRPDDPRAIAHLEGQFSAYPFLHRKSEIESMEVGGGPGAIFTWEGSNNGLLIQARVYAVIFQKYAIILFALGTKEQISLREATLREIFFTFGLGEGKQDPHLVGFWRYTHYYSSGNYAPSGNFSGVSERNMILYSNGTFRAGGRFMASMSHKNSSGQNTGNTSLDSGEKIEKGRWSAENGQLWLLWEDGSYACYKYHIEGNQGSRKMLFYLSNKKTQLWEEIP